jgi:periplasmic protein TonB
MFSTLQAMPGRRFKPNSWLSASLALHLAVLGLFLYHRQPILKVTQLPGDLNGHRLLLTYMPGQGSVSSAPRTPTPPHDTPDRLPTLHMAAAPPPSAISDPAASLTANNSTGTDTLGQGDIKIASLLVHPPPAPDLSKLPAGTRGDVIVDIVIDPNGHIAKYTMEHGLGHGIDETVIATIQQWTFQPATRDGVPVASEQELLFHYERG